MDRRVRVIVLDQGFWGLLHSVVDYFFTGRLLRNRLPNDIKLVCDSVLGPCNCHLDGRIIRPTIECHLLLPTSGPVAMRVRMWMLREGAVRLVYDCLVVVGNSLFNLCIITVSYHNLE